MSCDFAALACTTLFSWPGGYDLCTYEDLDSLVSDAVSSEGSGDLLPCRNPVDGMVGLHRPEDETAWIIPISDLSDDQQELAASPQGVVSLMNQEEHV